MRQPSFGRWVFEQRLREGQGGFEVGLGGGGKPFADAEVLASQAQREGGAGGFFGGALKDGEHGFGGHGVGGMPRLG